MADDKRVYEETSGHQGTERAIVPKLTEAEIRFERIRRTTGLFLGPILFLIIYLLPFEGLSKEAHGLAAIFCLVFSFWVTEAIPLPVTALLGPTLAVILGVTGAGEAFQSFAAPLIFLFIGSFILANAIFLHDLDRRVAYTILSIKSVASSPSRVLFAFGAICYFGSMWLSSTATTAMMFPIGLSILSFMKRQQTFDPRYSTGLMLMTTYAALMGGMATPVGTPPNLITIGMLREIQGYDISFFQWMTFALPISATLFLFLFFYLNRVCPSGVTDMTGSLSFLQQEKDKLGALTRGQKNVIVAFSTTVLLWVSPGLIAVLFGSDNPLYQTLIRLFPEAVAALVGVCLLFFLPINWKERTFTITWEQAVQIDWGTILLFGGGLSLGRLAFTTGLAESVGGGFLELVPTGQSQFIKLIAVTLLASLLMTVITEMVSNTASTNMGIPVILALATSLNVSYLPPVLGACLSASCAFTLPVSTPPNAIVFASGLIPITKMIRYGILLDIVGIVGVNVGILVYFFLI